jgi:ABC-type transport system involved in multi-copper enzyme maturation permease subunit
MIRLLVEKELRESLHSARWAAAFGVCSVLILLSFFLGAREHRSQVARVEAAAAQDVRQMEGLTDWINLRNHRIFLPPQPLEALVNGISADIGRTITVRGRGAPMPEGSRYGDEPLLAAFRFIDLDFLFQVVLSLFVIVFAYDAISGEKERGTLRLALAAGVPRASFIVGKLAGTLVSLVLPVVVPLLAGCVLLPLFGVRLSSDEWLRLGLVLVAGLVYLGVFAALALLVSALTHRSATSFLALLALWIGATMIIPRAAVLFSGRAVTVRPQVEIDTEVARLRAQLVAEDERAMVAFRPTHTGDPMVAVEEFNRFMNTQAEARQRKLDDLQGRLEEERFNQQVGQHALALGLARLSPAATFSLAATTIAGTSLDLPSRFRAQAVAYQREFAAFMFAKTGMNPGNGMAVRMRLGGEEPKPVDPSELPQFVYRPARISEVVPAALFNVALLLLMGIGVSSGAVAVFARYDAR